MYLRRSELDVPLALVEVLARVGSIASVTLLVMLFQAEALHPSQVTTKEWFALAFFPIGVVMGLMIAWWKEGIGAAVTLVSLMTFYFVYGYLLRYHISGWAFLLFASPAFLFLIHRLLYREEQSART